MSDEPENPNAFPVQWEIEDGTEVAVPGMTLRDYFAGQALACMNEESPSDQAEYAYRIADDMLSERERGGE